MQRITYNIGDELPNLSGIVSWPLKIDTDTITGRLVPNGAKGGPFTEEIDIVKTTSTPTESTLVWEYGVSAEDTKYPGRYNMNVALMHADGSQQTFDAKMIIVVKDNV